MTATLTRTRTVKYQRPKLYAEQQRAIFSPARYGVIEAATKTGKTVGCLVWLHEKAALYGGKNKNYWWVAPINTTAKIAFNRLRNFLPAGSFNANKVEQNIELLNGSVVWFKSGHDPDSLYGEDVYAAVIDEATRVKEDSWVAVRSTLTATKGPVRIIGNVKGRKNWAYRLARKTEQSTDGRKYHYARLTAYDAVKGGVFNLEEIEDARSVLPKQAFDELYLAIPGDDGSNPFGRQAIEDCTKPLATTSPYCFGWDLARGKKPGSDWTVGIGLDSERNACRLHRFQKPWSDQVRDIRALTGNTKALVDQTGVGDPVLEQIQKGGGNYEGFTFSPTSRQQLLEQLAIQISGRHISFPQSVADELDEFEYVYTPSGVVKYMAPEGLHDDQAMALALANKKYGFGGMGHVFRFSDEEDWEEE